ncbi:MAG: helix-turn-helix domain-containing protein [Actinomycetes bacterium]
MSTHENTSAGAALLGQALREVRRARKWSLADFEKASNGHVKAVVLGSYERGSRSVSVAKLQAIAEVYGVPISAFFTKSYVENSSLDVPNVIIDLRKLREELAIHSSKVLTLLDQFCSGIINFRKDWNGEILSLRRNDVSFLAIMSETSAENLLHILASKDVLFNFKD